jgi:hypothetical protein
MRYFKSGLVALLAVVAFAAVAASAAQAAPELLASKYPVSVNGSGETGNLNTTGGNNVECKANTVTGEVTSATAGKAKVKFTGCSKGCKTAGAAAKEIVIEVEIDFVLATVASAHVYVFWFLSVSVTLECTGETVVVKGNVMLTTTLKEKTATTSTTVEGKQASAGKQEVLKCEEPSSLCSTEASLKAKFGEGSEESASEVQKDSATFGASVEATG